MHLQLKIVQAVLKDGFAAFFETQWFHSSLLCIKLPAFSINSSLFTPGHPYFKSTFAHLASVFQ